MLNYKFFFFSQTYLIFFFIKALNSFLFLFLIKKMSNG